MASFDLFKYPKLQHPRFGRMEYDRGYWRCKANYLGSEQLSLLLHVTPERIDPSAQWLCDALETRFPKLKQEVATAMYEESYIPMREAIHAGEYIDDSAAQISVIETPADIWS